MKALIIAHGNMAEGEILIKESKDADLVICADGGAEYAARYNINPDFIIGDLDSVPKSIVEYFENRNVNIIRYSCEKDFTDTELCVYKAKEMGCSTICIAAGTGDRLDHSLGNIGLLHIMKEMDIKGYIFNDKEYIYLCCDKIDLYGHEGDVISIIPLYGTAEGLYSKGLKYQLNNLLIPLGSPIGVSNVMTDSQCSISICRGEILVIKQINI